MTYYPVDKLNFFLQKAVPQAYDGAASYVDLLNKVMDKLNEVVHQSNDYFAVDLETYAEGVLQKWADDGTLEALINDTALADVNTKVDGLTTQLAQSSHIKVLNILDYGAKVDGVTDDWTAFVSARTASWGVGKEPLGRVHFPKGTTFFKQNRPSLVNTYISADPEAVVKISEPNPNIKDWLLLTPLKVQDVLGNITIQYPQNVHYEKVLTNIGSAVYDINNDERYSLIDFTTWDNKVYETTTGDTSRTGTAVRSSDTVSWGTAFSQNPQFIKPTSLEPGTCYETNVTASNSNTTFGVLLKTADNHFINVVIATGQIHWKYREKDNLGNQILEKNYDVPNGGAYGLVLNEEQNIAFYYENSKRVVFMVADLTLFVYDGKYGDVVEAGFYNANTTNSNALSFKTGIKIQNYKYRKQKPLKLALIGDSISYGAWTSLSPDKILPIMLQNLNGIGKVTLTNYAISGRSTASWVTDINTYNFTGFDYVLVMIGTNDIQGNQILTTFSDNLTTIANKIVGDGAVPIFQVFPVFTNAANSGVIGVTTSNYEKHAKYSQTLKKWCIQNGYEFGNARRNFGANLDWYRDNIHPTDEGQIAVLKSWAEVLTRVLNK